MYIIIIIIIHTHTCTTLEKKGSTHYSFDGAGRLQLKLTEAHCQSPCLRLNTVWRLRLNTVWRFVSKVQWWKSHWGVTEVEIFKIHSSSQRSIAWLRSILDLMVFKDLRPDSLVAGVLPDLLCELHTSKATLLSPAHPHVDLYHVTRQKWCHTSLTVGLLITTWDRHRWHFHRPLSMCLSLAWVTSKAQRHRCRKESSLGRTSLLAWHSWQKIIIISISSP